MKNNQNNKQKNKNCGNKNCGNKNCSDNGENKGFNHGGNN